MNPEYAVSAALGRPLWRRLLICFLCGVTALAANAQTARIKRISLITPDLDQSIAFFTEVIDFTLDFDGVLPPSGEPFLGTIFNIDASRPHTPGIAVY